VARAFPANMHIRTAAITNRMILELHERFIVASDGLKTSAPRLPLSFCGGKLSRFAGVSGAKARRRNPDPAFCAGEGSAVSLQISNLRFCFLGQSLGSRPCRFGMNGPEELRWWRYIRS